MLRMHRTHRLLLFIVLALGPATNLAAQQTSKDSPAKNELGIWGGYSFDSPHVFGEASDRRFAVLALRYGRVFFNSKAASLEYTADIVPVAVMRQPSFVPCVILVNGVFLSAFCPVGRESVYGGGVSPLGLKANLLPHHQLQPFGAISVGFVDSLKPIPVDVPGGTQFNFTFDFQVGFQRFNAQHTRAWMVGYKLQHISNADRTDVNFGVDNNLFFFGYSFFKRHL